NGQGFVRPRLSFYLYMMFAPVAVLTLLLAGFLLYEYSMVEQSRLEEESKNATRMLATTLDTVFAAHLELVHVLSQSKALKENRLKDFYDFAKAAVRTPGSWIVLRAARMPDATTYVGKPVASEFLQSIRDKESGVWEGTTLDGFQLFAPFVRLENSQWVLSMGVPVEELRAPLWKSLYLLIAVVLSVLSISILIVVVLGRRILQ